MITKIDKETVQFICKHKLTFQQFCLCLLIYHKDVSSIIQINEEISVIGDCMIPVTIGGVKNYKHETNDLVDRGYLVNNNPRGEYSLDYFALTPKFTKDFLVDLTEAPKEAWEAYPKRLLIDNKELTSKTCTYDEFASEYLRGINFNIKEHKKAMLHLELMKKKSKYASCGIKKWAGGRLWNEEDLDKMSAPKSKLV
jgi:hypothetical protein